MIVDVHAHFVPQKMLDALARGRAAFPNVAILHEGGNFKLRFAGGPLTRPVIAKLREAELRHAWMTENNIDMQVTGGWLDAFGYELPSEEGAAWSRFLNEHLKEAYRFQITCWQKFRAPKSLNRSCAQLQKK